MLNILCVKIGNRYSSTLVNRLYKMCKKNITQPFKFFCYTEDPTNIIDEVNVIPFVDHGLEIIVHNKLFLFSEYVDKHLTSGDRLYFDLDLIIKSNIDDIVACNKGELTLIRASWRAVHPRGFPTWHHMYNSSCMTWRYPHTRNIWEHFIKDVEHYTCKYHYGMDCFLSYEHENIGTNIHFFPERKFHSHRYGIDLAEQLWSKQRHDCSFATAYPEVMRTIPIALLNGPTTEKEYEFYKEYYED